MQQRSAESDLWSDPAAAQATMQELAGLQDEVNSWQVLEHKAADLAELLELAQVEQDESLIADIAADTAALEQTLAGRRRDLMFSGEHDRRNAIMTISAGAGGTESQDWAEMLLRMYTRWAERRKFNSEVIDLTEGEEAGIKSATIEISGHNVYGNLRSARGVHRLVRLSPFDNQHRRQTSFAMVEVIPDVAGDINIEINPDDLQMDVFRASGHGGQNVQKNSTAVRITHAPTGIVVS
ncbi:MAG: PCRF domain-containing protein, partial [Chloroflexi bacterium]|nr:PCRF domain-containing protein [Chloroflexota bacterium]